MPGTHHNFLAQLSDIADMYSVLSHTRPFKNILDELTSLILTASPQSGETKVQKSLAVICSR